MKVQVLFFAALREALDCAQLQLELEAGSDTTELRQQLVARGGAWAVLAADRINVALNQQLLRTPQRLSDGDEVAFFPPVTGG